MSLLHIQHVQCNDLQVLLCEILHNANSKKFRKGKLRCSISVMTSMLSVSNCRAQTWTEAQMARLPFRCRFYNFSARPFRCRMCRFYNFSARPFRCYYVKSYIMPIVRNVEKENSMLTSMLSVSNRRAHTCTEAQMD